MPKQSSRERSCKLDKDSSVLQLRTSYSSEQNGKIYISDDIATRPLVQQNDRKYK